MAKNDLNLIVTEDRVKDVPLEVFYHLEDGSPKTLIHYIAHFVADENGEYLDRDQAVPIVLQGRTVGDIESIAAQLRSAVEDGVVPNV